MIRICIVLILFGITEVLSECIASVTLKTCSFDKPNIRYTFFHYNEEIDIINTCPEKTNILTITWRIVNDKGVTIKKFPKFDNKEVLIINKNDVRAGTNYALLVEGTSENFPVSSKCIMSFLGNKPEIIFKQGLSQHINSGDKFEVDVTNSKIDNKSPNSIHWLVTCALFNTEDCKSKCNYNYHGLKLSLTENKCSFRIEFLAKVVYGPIYISKKHYVFINPNSDAYSITCVQNCNSGGENNYTLVDQETVIKISCDPTVRCNAKWHITSFGGGYDHSKMEISKDTQRFVMKPKGFSQGGSYSINAQIGNDINLAIAVQAPPRQIPPPIKCSIEPLKGESLHTIFKVYCNLSNHYFLAHPPIFQVFQENGAESSFLLETAHDTFEFPLKATSNPTQQLKIIAIDENSKQKLAQVPPVTVTERKSSSIKEDLEKFKELVLRGNYPKAIAYGAGLISAIKELKAGKDEKNVYYAEILANLKKIIDKDKTSSKIILNLMPQFYENIDLNEKCTKMLSSLCNELTEINVKNTDERNQESVRDNYGLMAKCGDALLKQKENKTKYNIVITTPDMFVDDPSITEDYQNYDLVLPNSMDPMMKNSVDIISKAGQSVANRLGLGDVQILNGTNSETLVAKYTVNDMVNKFFNITGASLTVHKINGSDEDKATTILTSFQNDVFTDKDASISTTVVDMNIFLDENKTMYKVPVTFTLALDLIKQLEHFEEFNLTVPVNKSLWIERDYKDNLINIHRLNLPKHSSCFTKFFHVQTTDKLKVVFTQNRRPNLKDFDGTIYIIDGKSGDTQTLRCPLEKLFEHDHFVYIGVLPHEDMIERNPNDNLTVVYNVQFSKQVCLYYSEDYNNWVVAHCKVNFMFDKSMDRILCTCDHMTLFGARHELIKHKLDTVMTIAFKTEKFVEYIIFAHVAIVFLCYCIALTCTKRRMRKTFITENIYFLSDNLKNDRYAYLIIVKTGTLTYSGTTSNVVIQLFGEKGQSKSHVLNYPDPQKQLLQRDTIDWFILTNDRHLGNIESIKIWFDSIGFRAPWFCEYITIIDLQNKIETNFTINKWLTLGDKGFSEITVNTSDVDKKSKKEVRLFLGRHMRFYYGGLNTWNIFKTNHDFRFLYNQRLTVILSMIYTSYAVSLMFFGTPSLKKRDAYSYGTLGFHYEMIYISLLSAVFSGLLNFPFVFLFRNSESLQLPRTFQQEKKRFSQKMTKIVWVLIGLWIAACMLYLLVFGFWITRITSYLWMYCTTFAILFNIIVLENAYIIIMKVLGSLYFGNVKKTYDMMLILKYIERQRAFLFKTFGEILMRPYFTKQYRPLTIEEIKKYKERQKERLRVIALFRDFCIFIIYLTFLYLICLAHSDQLFYKSNSEISEMLEGTFREDYFPLDDIHQIRDIYKYINDTVIPVTHSSNWYGDYYMKNPGMMADFNSKVLGIIQLRQQRNYRSCDSLEFLRYLNLSCPKDYFAYKRWVWNNGSDISNSLGQYVGYDGSGYITFLGRTLYNSYYLLNQLIENNYLDMHTKVLFIEFWAYNVNFNLFNAVRVTIEHEDSGHILKSINVISTRLIIADPVWNFVYITLFFGFLFSSTIMMIIMLVNVRFKFFRSFWNLVDVVLLLLSAAKGVLFFYTEKAIRHVIKDLEYKNHNEFVYYFKLFTISLVVKYVSAILICIATMRLLKYYEFGNIFQVMARAFKTSIRDIIITTLYQLYIFYIFACYIYIMYGSSILGFVTVPSALNTLFLCQLNLLDELYTTRLIKSEYSLFIHYGLFTAFGIGFFSLYCTILMQAIEKSRIFYSNKKKIYSLNDFFRDESTYYFTLMKVNYKKVHLKGGSDSSADELRLVYPKEPLKRYADCVTVTKKKMTLMRLVAMSVILQHNNEDFTESEEQYRLMARLYLTLIIRENASKYQDFMFFKGKNVLNNTTKFVPDIRLLQMEFITNKILKQDDIYVTEEIQPFFHISGDADRLTNLKDLLALIVKFINNIKIVEK